MKRFTPVLIVVTLVVSCAKNEPPVHPSPPAPKQKVHAPQEVPVEKEVVPETSKLVIAQSIRDACGISDAEAFFEFNSAQVSTLGESVLRKLADCFTVGPLKGRPMELVGHADPRGSEEYNLALGSRRAQSVKDTLGTLGLSASAVTTSSRGEAEATGMDLASWPHDRRVDVTLGL